MLVRTPMWADLSADSDTDDSAPLEALNGREPNVLTSRRPCGYHAITLDVDHPCAVIPSSTPGHYHLLIDVDMPWDEYVRLLTSLAEFGVVSFNYVQHSINRGATAIRLPWVNKHDDSPAPITEGEEPF